ncbi:MAG: flagellar hook capping FlgD N-terminal domain-containing protein [Dehalococcoidia bacterium]
MVQDISNAGKGLNDMIPTSQRTVGRDLDQQDFLKIMIEQMRGQNPLSESGGTEDFFAQLVQFQTLESMQGMTKAIELLAEVSSLSQSASLIGRAVVAEIPVEVAIGEVPQPPQIVEGEVTRVTFGQQGAVVELDSGLRVPVSRIVAVQ